MKMYRINNKYYGTQSDAKPAMNAIGVKYSTIAQYEVDVPTTKDDLIAYLNSIAETTERLPAPPMSVAPVQIPVQIVASQTPHLDRALHNINVEDEIEKADFPNAVRLAEHANDRVAWHLKRTAWHLKQINDAAFLSKQGVAV